MLLLLFSLFSEMMLFHAFSRPPFTIWCCKCCGFPTSTSLWTATVTWTAAGTPATVTLRRQQLTVWTSSPNYNYKANISSPRSNYKQSHWRTDNTDGTIATSPCQSNWLQSFVPRPMWTQLLVLSAGRNLVRSRKWGSTQWWLQELWYSTGSFLRQLFCFPLFQRRCPKIPVQLWLLAVWGFPTSQPAVSHD